MRRYLDYIGEKFGRLTLIEVLSEGKQKRGIFQCDCGLQKNIMCQSVFQGLTVSCGCYHKEALSNRAIHGLAKHPLYKVWYGIINRCYNEEHLSYINYGGRGICLCEEWINSPIEFIQWGIFNGWRKGLQIDRKDNNGNYEPLNCRFIERVLNNRNKRSSIYIEYNGERKHVSEWALLYNLKHGQLARRIKDGWDVKAALTTPVVNGNNQHQLSR